MAWVLVAAAVATVLPGPSEASCLCGLNDCLRGGTRPPPAVRNGLRPGERRNIASGVRAMAWPLLFFLALCEQASGVTGLRGTAAYVLVPTEDRVSLLVRNVQVSSHYDDSLSAIVWGSDGRRLARLTVQPGQSRSVPLNASEGPFAVRCQAGRNAIEAEARGGILLVDERADRVLRLFGRTGPLYFRIAPTQSLTLVFYAEEPAEVTLVAPDGTAVWHRAIPDHTHAKVSVPVQPGWSRGSWHLTAALQGDLSVRLGSAVVAMFSPVAIDARLAAASGAVVMLDGVPVARKKLMRDRMPQALEALRTEDGLVLWLGGDGGIAMCGPGQPTRRGPWPWGGFAVLDHSADGRIVLGRGELAPRQTEDAPAALQVSFPGTPCRLVAALEAGAKCVRVSGRIVSRDRGDRAVTVLCLIPIPGAEVWWNDIDTQETLARMEEVEQGTGAGSEAPVTRLPWACVSAGRWLGNNGVTCAIPLNKPRVCRMGYLAATGQLFVAFDFALTPATEKFPNRADFEFIVYRVDGAWGLRDGLRRYYKLYPEDFRVRIGKLGGWVCWGNLADVADFGDFGFQYHWGPAGASAVAYDDEHGVYSFLYNDSVRYFADLGSFDRRPSHEQANAVFRQLLTTSDPRGLILSRPPKATGRRRYESRERSMGREAAEEWLRESIEAARKSACLAADGSYQIGYIINRKDWGPPNWWTGRLFCNPDPDIPGGYGTFLFKRILEPTFQRYRAEGGELDGVGLDNFFVYANYLDFRQEHFAFVDHPLVFDPDTLKPAAMGDFIFYEWVEELARRMHSQGKWLIANLGRWPYPFAARLLDIHGFEWGIERVAALARALAYHKPVVSLPTQDEHYEEGFVRRHVRWAFFPGGYATKSFAQRSGVRKLYRKYVPAIRACAEAGWEPVTWAKASAPEMKVERFGGPGVPVLFTVANEAEAPTEATVSIDAKALGLPANGLTCVELITGRPLRLARRRSGLELRLKLGAGEVAVARVDRR